MGNHSSQQSCLKKNAVCTLQSDLINGYVYFHQCKRDFPVRVIIDLSGPPLQTHAIHIHEYGDMRRGCDSLGLHFNPYDHTHGSIEYKEFPRHAGDMINNVTFDLDGRFIYEYKDELISLYEGEMNNIIGRSIVIHKQKDDLGRGKPRKESLKTGNSGERICCGVIGISKSY